MQVQIALALWRRLEKYRSDRSVELGQRFTFQQAVAELLDKGLPKG